MNKKTYMSLKSRVMSSVPACFFKNKDGIAAIEFALIAPIMITMYFGMAEMASAISVDRQVSHSANVAGDLATQLETISAAQMSEIMAATLLVMNIPENRRDNVKIEIASYAKDDSDTIIKKGVATFNGNFPTTFDADDLDESILSETSGVVVARVFYTYEPLGLAYTSLEFDIAETFLLKPRRSPNVDILDESTSTPSNKYNCSYSDEDGTLGCTRNGTIS